MQFFAVEVPAAAAAAAADMHIVVGLVVIHSAGPDIENSLQDQGVDVETAEVVTVVVEVGGD